jgi:hypothetical protein
MHNSVATMTYTYAGTDYANPHAVTSVDGTTSIYAVMACLREVAGLVPAPALG